MDLSALIFVALAVAWAVYLIPKALRHHEEESETRSVDRFSDRMRVVARREVVSANRAALVVAGEARTTSSVGGPAPTPEAEPAEPAIEDEPASEAEPAVPAAAVSETETEPPAGARPRTAAARAARRRRRVLGVILLAHVVMAALAVGKVVGWAWLGVPAALLVAWLVACRLMVRRERAARPLRTRRATRADQALAEEAAAHIEDIPAVAEETSETAERDGWDPVPITLPTYVDKAPVGRTVRTIDLDATGVWSSGRNAADSQLAREAERDAKRSEQPDERRATGS